MKYKYKVSQKCDMFAQKDIMVNRSTVLKNSWKYLMST